jgi:beta-N-acetylhexosaminidase
VVNSDLRRDAGQLLWIGIGGTELTVLERRRFSEGRAGGTVLFARNLAEDAAGGLEVEALLALIAEMRAAAKECGEVLLVAVDQEGGRVQRVRSPAVRWPPMLAHDRLPAEEAVAVAEQAGEAIGRELAALDFDIDFAPVLDVHTNPENPVIGDRAFSTHPERAAERALAFARGLAHAGLLACGKHFPGHGDTSNDSHLELPRVEHELERLRRVELLPFARAAAAALPMMMTAHVVFAAFDSAPATLSARVVRELLRGELGYRGIVVSDDLDMKAIADHFGVEDAAARAVEAGCDVLLLCKDPDHQDRAYEALVRRGELSSGFRERLAGAAASVRRLKQRHFQAGRSFPSAAAARHQLGRAAEEAFLLRLTGA